MRNVNFRQETVFFFVLSDLAEDFASSVIPQSHFISAPFISGVQRQLSRYFNEFEELQLLGKGAFGAVIKVGSFYTLALSGYDGVSTFFRT